MKALKVLSLFDGMSCGQIALERAGIKVEKYYASEIKKHAIEVTQHNYPNTIQLGDVTKITKEMVGEIDLLIGGSPCQDFSRANSVRDGLQGTKSMLFYEYLRLLNELKPKYYILENVIMDDTGYKTISDLLGTEPSRINSSLVSGALRDRLYWTNIGRESFDLFGNRKSEIPQPKDKAIKLQDILEFGYTKKLKHSCLNTKSGQDGGQKAMLHRDKTTGMTTLIYNSFDFDETRGVRYVTQTEMERLHNIPEGYTKILNKKKAGDLIGDGWTVDVVAHILSFIPICKS